MNPMSASCRPSPNLIQPPSTPTIQKHFHAAGFVPAKAANLPPPQVSWRPIFWLSKEPRFLASFGKRSTLSSPVSPASARLWRSGSPIQLANGLCRCTPAGMASSRPQPQQSKTASTPSASFRQSPQIYFRHPKRHPYTRVTAPSEADDTSFQYLANTPVV